MRILTTSGMKFRLFIILILYTQPNDNYFVNYIKRENKDVDTISEVYVFKDVVLGGDLAITTAYFDFSFSLLNNLKFESLQLLYQCTVEKLDQLKSLKDCSQNTSGSVGPFNIKLFLFDFNFSKRPPSQHFVFLFKIRFLSNEKYKTIKKSIRSLDRLIQLTPNELSTTVKKDKPNKVNKLPTMLVTNSIKNNPLEIVSIPKLKTTNNVLNSKFRLKKDIKNKLKNILNIYLNSLIKPSEYSSPTKSNISKLLKFKGQFRNSLDFIYNSNPLNSPNPLSKNSKENQEDKNTKIKFTTNTNTIVDLKIDFDFKIAIAYNTHKLKEDIQNIYNIYFNLFKLNQSIFFQYNDYLKGVNSLVKEKIANLDDKKVQELVIKIGYEKLSQLIDSNIIQEFDNSRKPSMNKLDSFYKIEPRSASKRKTESENTESLNNTMIEKEEYGKSAFGKMCGNNILNTDIHFLKNNESNEPEDFGNVEEFNDATVYGSDTEKNDERNDIIRRASKSFANNIKQSKRNSKMDNKLVNKLKHKETKNKETKGEKSKEENKNNSKGSAFVVGLCVMIVLMAVAVLGCFGYKIILQYIKKWEGEDVGIDRVNDKENESRKRNKVKDMNVPKKPFELIVPDI